MSGVVEQAAIDQRADLMRDEGGLAVLVVRKEQPGNRAGGIVGDQAWPIGQVTRPGR